MTSDHLLQIVQDHGEAGAQLRREFFNHYGDLVVEAARAMAVSLARGGKILLCGNGGSAADCQHIAAEFTNRFMMERPPLPALALTTDSSALTSIGNDYSFDMVFEKQVRAFGSPGDVLVGISTSGNSPNVLKALECAREHHMVTIGLTGGGGGTMVDWCDHLLLVPDKRTPLIQEVHIAVGHLLCLLVDHFLFEGVGEIQDLI